MSTYGSGVPWWRVVRADGTLPQCHQRRALESYRVEGTPLRGAAAGLVGETRVDMREAVWDPVTAGSECL
jgi:alkylated DNA nucleotide flippase Atl1